VVSTHFTVKVVRFCGLWRFATNALRGQKSNYEMAWKQLLEWRVGLRRGRPAADRLVNYVSERREMIKYPQFQAKGWQIGSGPTEATCKTLTARLKGSGMRWEADNAEALMALEALTQSGQWDLYWQSQLPRTG
jgi:hypothetical protein